MTDAEVPPPARGAVLLRLNVLGHDAVARSLYAGLGLQVTSVQMHRRR